MNIQYSYNIVFLANVREEGTIGHCFTYLKHPRIDVDTKYLYAIVTGEISLKKAAQSEIFILSFEVFPLFPVNKDVRTIIQDVEINGHDQKTNLYEEDSIKKSE